MSRDKNISEPIDVELNSVSGNELDQRKEDTRDITLKEAKKLEEEMEITIEEMKCSEFYYSACNQLQNDIALREKFKCVLENHPAMTMVIYCLGSLEFSYTSQYQLALAILLQRDFSHWIGENEVSDPLFSPVDVIVLEKLGCKALKVNEHCRRKVEKPTLFFIPAPFYHLFANLLETNWHPSRINLIILLTDSFTDHYRGQEAEDGENDLGVKHNEYIIRMNHYVKSIQRNTKEIRLPLKCNYQYSESLHVCDYSWHFFDVRPEVNMELLFPGIDFPMYSFLFSH